MRDSYIDIVVDESCYRIVLMKFGEWVRLEKRLKRRVYN
jgi:hypothetical protein